MIDTIMFDLDGTLLHLTQKGFLGVYLPEISKVFAKTGLDAEPSIAALWAGIRAMVLNDGSSLNVQRFWQAFAEHAGIGGERLAELESACDSYYANEFNFVKKIVTPSDIPKRLVRAMASKGYGVILATNPLFPLCAIETRLDWAGLGAGDFRLVTHYYNSTFCKPNPKYYSEILTKIDKSPEQCLMAGNSPSEDMVSGTLGMETYLVTDCLENETGMDIDQFRRGTLAELETYLTSLPDIR